MKYYCINNIFSNSSSISYQDRGFRFGDGVFETIRVLDFIPYLLEYHIERLSAGLEALQIKVDLEVVKQNLFKLIEINQHEKGLIRIIISRGIGSMGYLPYKTNPTVIIETDSVNENVCKHQIDVFISNFEKISPQSLPNEVKLLQGLNPTLAKMEAVEKGFDEALLLNSKQQICELSSGNIFWVRNERIYTPSTKCGLINGIIRRRIMEIFPILTGEFLLQDLIIADEVFATNSIWPILQVKRIGKINFTEHKTSTAIHQAITEDRDLYVSKVPRNFSH